MAEKKHKLFKHATGQWARKVKLGGVWKLRYFGTDEARAVERYLAEKEYLDAGLEPPSGDPTEYASVLYVTEAWLQSKQVALKIGRITQNSFNQYEDFAQAFLDVMPRNRAVEQLRPSDFDNAIEKFAARWGPVRLRNAVRAVKSIFRRALEHDEIDRLPIFGDNFRPPDKAKIRLHRAKKGERMLEPPQLRKLIAEATGALKPAILLGLNCGFNNGDVIQLRPEHIKGTFLVMHRNKTGINRRCPLWPETLAALEACPPPFTSRRGNALTPVSVSQLFRNLVTKHGFYRDGISFGTLRHVHQTAGELSEDSLAIKMTMGHADGSISDTYRERFPDARLLKVTNAIRDWLFSGK